MATDELEKELGTRLRALRIDRHLTQQELADRANVSLGALKHLESGAPATTTTLAKVLRALGEERWIGLLGPGPEPFNPMALLESRQQRATSRPARVRRRRVEVP